MSCIGESDGVVFAGSSGISTYYSKRRDIGKRNIYAIDFEPTEKKLGQIFIVAGHHLVEPAGDQLLDLAHKYIQMHKISI